MQRPRKCANCYYFDNSNNNNLCRNEPPKSLAVPGAAPPVKIPGARPQIGFLNWWPSVDPERDWCGFYLDELDFPAN